MVKLALGILALSLTASAGLYQPSGCVTLEGFPNHPQNDSRWQTEGGLPWAKRSR